MTELIEQGRGLLIAAGGLDTNYHDQGVGDPVILLHGSGPGVSAWTNWKRVIPALSDRFRVLAPDMAGFGYTERNPDIRYDIKFWVKHLIGILDALGLEKVSLVGSSFSVIYLKNGRVIALDCINATKDFVHGRALVADGARIDGAKLADATLALKELPRLPCL